MLTLLVNTKTNQSISNRVLMLFSLVFILASCSNDDKELKSNKAFIANVQTLPSAPLEALPDVTMPPLPSTNPLNKRNPFAPTITNNQIKPDANHVKAPLELLPLTQLSFVGVLASTTQLWALINTPGGEIYNVSVGDYLGQNNGKITQITPQKVIIIETISTDLGGWINQTKELALTLSTAVDQQKGTTP